MTSLGRKLWQCRLCSQNAALHHSSPAENNLRDSAWGERHGWRKRHTVLRIAFLFFTPSLLACCLWGSLAGARTNLYTAISTELIYLCHRALPTPAPLQWHQSYMWILLQTCRHSQGPVVPRASPFPTPQPAPGSLRGGGTYSQCHTLQSHRWGRTGSRFSSSQTAARGGRRAVPGTCSGSAAPAGRRSGWCSRASTVSRGCSCAPLGSSPGCTSYIPAKKENHSLFTY